MTTDSIEIKCPRCGQKTVYSTVNKFRPFCSERCKLIDLGDWASNKFAIPVVEKNPIESESEEVGSNQIPSNIDGASENEN
jgi:uncharacterized protein